MQLLVRWQCNSNSSVSDSSNTMLQCCRKLVLVLRVENVRCFVGCPRRPARRSEVCWRPMPWASDSRLCPERNVGGMGELRLRDRAPHRVLLLRRWVVGRELLVQAWPAPFWRPAGSQRWSTCTSQGRGTRGSSWRGGADLTEAARVAHGLWALMRVRLEDGATSTVSGSPARPRLSA